MRDQQKKVSVFHRYECKCSGECVGNESINGKIQSLLYIPGSSCAALLGEAMEKRCIEFTKLCLRHKVLCPSDAVRVVC